MERVESFLENLLVRIHFIIEMILVDRPCAMGIQSSLANAESSPLDGEAKKENTLALDLIPR